ncbi:hypothetical protein ES677_06820 [Bizionia gelidisalsuginis]|uniref:Uncharacterized protein n=1 Tax=Bizionia gelidisalsuginis TaxID=291188 RepID=A0ABY3MAZ6_9FLAO|nr:hypothetical protein [Bizionia gelidisalsuginis]TYC13437.1 hypothetical protein ES677_06820 [Bizionia gelidisalsuginis]
MSKKLISFFFTLLFAGFLMMPTIIVALDDSANVLLLFSVNEEEENSKSKTFEVVHTSEDREFDLLQGLKVKVNSKYCFKNYLKPHLNLISPPPEHS